MAVTFISLLAGSPQDAASCISIMATNGGKPQDYVKVLISAKKGLPVVAINTQRQELPQKSLLTM